MAERVNVLHRIKREGELSGGRNVLGNVSSENVRIPYTLAARRSIMILLNAPFAFSTQEYRRR